MDFSAPKFSGLAVYTPGEQPKDKRYLKLNTNESPFPLSPRAQEALKRDDLADLRLYSDPESTELTAALAAHYGLCSDQVLVTNGSDEALAFAFLIFCQNKVRYPAISYGFYRSFASLARIEACEVELKEDFSIDPADYFDSDCPVVIANPNAPTGLALPRCAIEEILRRNPGQIVVIDEAYVDFGAESAVPLIARYPNLVVVGTFSKSRSLAGGRIGFALSSKDNIDALKRIKYSFNPYNVNRMSAIVAKAAVEDDAYFRACCAAVAATRERTKTALIERGFGVTDSKANFLFAAHPAIDGETLYLELKKRGVLVRFLKGERLRPYVRVSVGSDADMERFLAEVDAITASCPCLSAQNHV